jgi:MFS family permease
VAEARQPATSARRDLRLPIFLLMAAGVSGDATVNLRGLGAEYRALAWHASPAWLGLLAAAPPGMYFLTLLFGGHLSDRLGRRRAASLGLVINLTALAGHCFATQLWQLLFWTALFGASGAFFWPTLSAWFSDLASSDPRSLNRMLGNFNVAWSGGMTLGAFLGGVLWQLLGVGSFVAEIVVQALVAVGIQLVPEGPRGGAEADEPVEEAHPDTPRFLLCTRLANFVGWAAVSALLALLPKLTSLLGISAGATGVALGAFYGAMLLLIWVARGSRRWQYRRWPVALPVPLMIVGMGMLLWARTVPVMALACFLAGCCSALAVVTALYYALHGRQTGRAAATRIHEAVVGAGAVSGGLLSGLVAQRLTAFYPAETAVRGAFLLVIAIAVLAGLAQLIAWHVMRPRPQVEPPPARRSPHPGGELPAS